MRLRTLVKLNPPNCNLYPETLAYYRLLAAFPRAYALLKLGWYMDNRGNYPVFFLAGLYLALQTRGLSITDVGGGITITGGYLIVALLAVYGALTLGQQETLLEGRGSFGFILAFSLLVLLVFQTARSPQPVRGFTLVGIQGMGLITFLIAAASINTRNQLRYLNVCVYVIGSIIAAITLAGYALIVLFSSIDFTTWISSGFGNWQLVAMPANRILYRLTGFVGDPHFYVWYTTPALIAGIVSTNGWRRLGIVPLSAAILLAMSRTWFVIFPASVLFVFLLASLSGRSNRLAKLVLTPFGVFAGVTGFVVGIAFALQPVATSGWIKRRLFATVFNDRRFTEYWPELATRIIEKPLLGYGSRSVEFALGVTAHNGYLGLLHDFGAIGLLLWAGIVFLALRATAQAIVDGRSEALPWIFAVLLTFGMNFLLSFQYDLFVWLVTGIALSNAMNDGTSGKQLILESSVAVKKLKYLSRKLRAAFEQSVAVQGTTRFQQRIGVIWRNSVIAAALTRILAIEDGRE